MASDTSCSGSRSKHRTTIRARPLLVSITLLVLALVHQTDGNSDSDWLQSCSTCHCHWNSGKKTADCKNKSLTTIPNDLSSEMQVVDLSNNVIPELRRDEFLENNLPNLHKIFMRNCTTQELNRDALKGLTILIELDLSHNMIRELHATTFNGLVRLRVLVMNFNEIEVLDNYLFADLHFLSRVEFKNNRLKRVEIHAFGQLPLLSAVYLEANSLTALRKETFSQTPKLVHLSLAQNPWNCTCELQEFRDFVLANRLYTHPTDCNEPKHLHGKLWSEIPSENFACKPKILGSVRSFVEAQSDNITLPCRIEGSPRPNVTWIYNKRPINPNDQRYRVLDSIEQGRAEHGPVLTSELRIFGVRATDKGAYTCVADNRGGKAEAEFQLIVNGDYFGALDGTGGATIGASSSDTQTSVLLIICLIATTLLLLLIIVVLVICWYCRRIRTYQKDSTMMSENGLINSKMEKAHHNGSILEGSVIMEMQKSLLTEVNPVEKPPRRTELDSGDSVDEVHEIKKTLLDDTQFGNHPRDDETHSVALSDTIMPRSRHTYVDDTYGTSLPPDLLAFPARLPPTSPSMQSSQSNIPDQVIYGIRSPPLASPVYTHMTPHGIYGTTTIAAATPNGFMTLQHPKSRNLALIAAANSRQQQSPFVPAPVVYTPTAAVVMKQGYMTIPRKPRVPSWAPSSSATHSTQLSEFQSPTSPNPSETGTATTAELAEPVYDNLGLRTTAGGNSTLNLHKAHVEANSSRYNMRDRPLPATPSLTSVASNAAMQQMQQNQFQQNQLQQQQQQLQLQHHQLQQQQQQLQQQHLQQQAQQQQTQQHLQQQHQQNATQNATKIYEPIHEMVNHLHHPTTTSDTEPLYGTARHHSGLTIVPSVSTPAPTGAEPKVAKIPPRPPPKPKKKMSVTTTRGGQGSTSQLFEDEGEDGTEV